MQCSAADASNADFVRVTPEHANIRLGSESHTIEVTHKRAIKSLHITIRIAIKHETDMVSHPLLDFHRHASRPPTALREIPARDEEHVTILHSRNMNAETTELATLLVKSHLVSPDRCSSEPKLDCAGIMPLCVDGVMAWDAKRL